MTNLDKVLKLLPTLTPTERTVVVTRLKGYIALGPSQEQSPPVDDYLLEGIHAELRRRGLLGMDVRITPGAPYTKASAVVRTLLESKLPKKLDNARRAALGVIAIRALADYLELIGAPVTRTALVSPNYIGSIPAALERSFPGYLRAGLLPFIWTSKECRTTPPQVST